jgi:hypothetical protein
LFGRSFGEISGEYVFGVGRFIAPPLHLATLALALLVLLSSDKDKHARTVAWYFFANYLWLLLYVGIYMSVLFYQKMGPASFMFWGAMPVLLAVIAIQWLVEAGRRKNDFDFASIPRHRLIVLPFIAFGFWYPTYIWNSGFTADAKDLLFSAYGLMPCPTTMLVLAVLAMKYPKVNKPLFYSLTLYSVIVGTAQIAIGYLPDYPLAAIGYYSLAMIVLVRIRGIGGARGLEA